MLNLKELDLLLKSLRSNQLLTSSHHSLSKYLNGFNLMRVKAPQ